MSIHRHDPADPAAMCDERLVEHAGGLPLGVTIIDSIGIS
jgi:hypothetical protein